MNSIIAKYIRTFLPYATVLPESNIAMSNSCRHGKLVDARDPVGIHLVGEMSPRVTTEDLENSHGVHTATHQITGQRVELHTHMLWRRNIMIVVDVVTSSLPHDARYHHSVRLIFLAIIEDSYII